MELTEQVEALARRVADLEREVQESRAVHARVAVLIDVVAELLIPMATRDEARVDELLERYRTLL